jgi:hypothetical protein
MARLWNYPPPKGWVGLAVNEGKQQSQYLPLGRGSSWLERPGGGQWDQLSHLLPTPALVRAPSPIAAGSGTGNPLSPAS